MKFLFFPPKECELDTVAELRVLPSLPPFLPHQAVKSGKVRPFLPNDFFFFFKFFLDSPAFAGLGGVREEVFPSLGIRH